jgi:uncharacterized membrane protein YgaE (UPF0421/DUF939 family)
MVTMFLRGYTVKQLFLCFNDFAEVRSLGNKKKNNLDDEIIKNLDKNTIDKKMIELEEVFTELKERELQKATNEMEKKAVLEAFKKAIKELNEAREQIEKL